MRNTFADKHIHKKKKMGISSFVKMFKPKDKIFFGLFEEVANNLVDMAKIFSDSLKLEDIAKQKQMLKSLEDLEHKNDEFTHRIFIELGQNFITPFDREDIHYLATALDDVADYIWGSSKRITNYYIDDVDDVIRSFSDVITRCVDQLNIAVHELRDMKNLRAITEACVVINSLENEGDELLDKAMANLFSSSIDPIELIKKKDLYQEMEIVTDKCEDAANVIESIIIKYA